jgi:hypothetical protein
MGKRGEMREPRRPTTRQLGLLSVVLERDLLQMTGQDAVVTANAVLHELRYGSPILGGVISLRAGG